jgi:hypothetical protein
MIIGWVDSHAPTLNPTQDIKCALCQSKGKIKMMLKKNGHVIFLQYSLKTNLLLFLPIVQMGIYTPLPLRNKILWQPPTLTLDVLKNLTNSKLLVPIASNKNAQKSNKNPKDMMGGK